MITKGRLRSHRQCPDGISLLILNSLYRDRMTEDGKLLATARSETENREESILSLAFDVARLL